MLIWDGADDFSAVFDTFISCFLVWDILDILDNARRKIEWKGKMKRRDDMEPSFSIVVKK